MKNTVHQGSMLQYNIVSLGESGFFLAWSNINGSLTLPKGAYTLQDFLPSCLFFLSNQKVLKKKGK